MLAGESQTTVPPIPTVFPTVQRGEKFKQSLPGTSLAVHWRASGLGLYASTAVCVGSISGQETKIPQAAEQGPKF